MVSRAAGVVFAAVAVLSLASSAAAGSLSSSLRTDLAHGTAPALVRVLVGVAGRRGLAGTAAAVEGAGGRIIHRLPRRGLVAALVPSSALESLAADAGVGLVRSDLRLSLPAPPPAAAPATGEPWHLALVGIPELRALGLDGAGVVVASLDTGVDGAHPALAPRFRGWAGDWFDPYGQHATPADVDGHGTATTGLAVGDGVGAAPGAWWIAARVFDDAGQAYLSDIHACLAWALDPDGVPSTPDAPGVVLCAWGFPDLTGQLFLEFEPDLAALRAAGQVVVFAAGNGGPAPETSVSPANNPSAFAVGACDGAGAVASFSGRGPAPLSTRLYPDVVVPGVAVETLDLSLGGVVTTRVAVSGTSYAVGLVAGVVAVLRQAAPAATGDEILAALRRSATDVEVFGADFAAGHGLVHAAAAVDLLLGGRVPGDVNGDGLVDWDDEAEVGLHFGETGGAADLDGDGTVGWGDHLLVQRRLLAEGRP